MARKINKKSRQSIRKCRRGAINKRTLRHNKSRIGGEISSGSFFNTANNPKFSFNYSGDSYSIEKQPRSSTYNILLNGNKLKEYEKIQCKDIISRFDTKIEDDFWFIRALQTLIGDYNKTTDKGKYYKKFRHFNELFVRMIKHFIDNYKEKYPNEHEIALSIQKIIEKGVSFMPPT
jgi:hypothetical protein